MTGRTVRYMLMAFENAPSVYNKLCGKYVSMIGSQKSDGESLQVKINNQPILQSPAVTAGYKYGLLEEVFGLPLMVPSCMFSPDGQFYDYNASQRSQTDHSEQYTRWWNNQGFSRDTLWGHPQWNLVGTGHYLGINLHKPIYTQDGSLQRANIPGSGVLISETPIQIDYIREVVGANSAGGADADYSPSDNVQRIMVLYCAVEKRTILKNGKFSTTQT
jgi:hypothetical protein